tara:strand:- start:630 stop:1679 length:1050 start_codon:yes stop_codon:yes gene_type:complete
MGKNNFHSGGFHSPHGDIGASREVKEGPSWSRNPMRAGQYGEITRPTTYSSSPSQYSRDIWGMKTHRDPGNLTYQPQWDNPVKFDYSQARKDTMADRQHVGFVPRKFGEGEKYYIPASQAYEEGYFDDPNEPGKSYFETNPEFKTFFPYEPDYAGLAALNEFERTGGGIYDETGSKEARDAYGFYTTDHPYNIGGQWTGPKGEMWMSARPHVDDISKRIALNLSPEVDDWAKGSYMWSQFDSDYPTTDRAYKDTAKHEMKHHWLQGNVNPEATDLYRSYKGPEHDDPWHEEIHLGEYMWSPKIDTYGLANLDQAQNFMQMHRLGKNQFLAAQQPNYAGFNSGGIVSLMI